MLYSCVWNCQPRADDDVTTFSLVCVGLPSSSLLPFLLPLALPLCFSSSVFFLSFPFLLPFPFPLPLALPFCFPSSLSPSSFLLPFPFLLPSPLSLSPGHPSSHPPGPFTSLSNYPSTRTHQHAKKRENSGFTVDQKTFLRLYSSFVMFRSNELRVTLRTTDPRELRTSAAFSRGSRYVCKYPRRLLHRRNSSPQLWDSKVIYT